VHKNTLDRKAKQNIKSLHRCLRCNNYESINQSVSQSVCPPVSPSIDQSINQI